MPVNATSNARRGQIYRVQPTRGGVFHVYPNGYKAFVPTSAVAPAASVPQAIQPQQPKDFAPDSAYFLGAAGRRHKLDDDLTANQAQGTSNAANYQEALRRLQAQRPRDERQATESYNDAGLFYSGQLGKKLGDIAGSYAERQADLRGDFDQREAARVAARQALQSGYTIEDATAQAEAADRQIGRDANAADAAALVAESPAAPPAPPAPALPSVRRPRVAAPTRRRPRRRR